jgi:NodT family efflux transporter outer membrane factor (OMF) lipoprotein
MIARRLVLAAVAAALAAGCVGAPGQAPHEAVLAPDTLALQGDAYVAPADAWWQQLGDPQLDRLVAESLARNPSLAAALARVRSAEQQAVIAGSINNPQVSLDADATRERVSANYIFPPPYGGATLWEARLGANLSWNIDFWGRQSSLIDQARQVANAAGLDAAGTQLLISSAVTQTYVELARARALEALAVRAGEQRQRLLALTQQRVSAGLDSNVELRSAEANVALVQVDREQAALSQESAIHALAALSGHGAEAYAHIEAPSLDFARALDLPQALPADLLAHRPDVAAARIRILAAQSGREAAHANFYPNVDLVAFAGFVSIGLDKLLDSDSQQWSVGPAIHLPIFDAGRLKAEYRKSGADLDVATASYNETVLRAVRESADQVSRLQGLDRQLADQQRAVEAAESAYSLAEQRYGAGLANYLTVLNAETQVLSARRQRVNLLADRTSARVALLVALGGSFKEPSR